MFVILITYDSQSRVLGGMRLSVVEIEITETLKKNTDDIYIYICIQICDDPFFNRAAGPKYPEDFLQKVINGVFIMYVLAIGLCAFVFNIKLRADIKSYSIEYTN